MKIKYSLLVCLLAAAGLFLSCEKEKSLLKDPVTQLSNDCIKRTLPTQPNIAGDVIEFAYAMALPSKLGKLTSAEAEATIAGAEGTRFDPNSYYTDNSGKDIPVPVCSESQTTGAKTSIQFTADTCAATLRYYYVIPTAARGKDVSFKFSVKSSNGQTAEYELGPYSISKMDMTLNQPLVHGQTCYLSFHNEGEAVHVYSAEEVSNASVAASIDLVYVYSTLADVNHAFFTPAAPADLHPGVTIPSAITGNSKLVRVYNLQDRQLSNLNNAKFIDDLDFVQKDFTGYTNYALRMGEQYGVWVETADAKYRAYVYVNSVAANIMTISVKRYPM